MPTTTLRTFRRTKNFPRAIAGCLLAALTLAPHAETANLITDPYFTNITYSGAATLAKPYYGEFGTGTGSTLTVNGWSTTGYNFVFSPSTVDVGTGTGGTNTGSPNEAPGQYNKNGYGNTWMWGANNGGTTTYTAVPGAGGNFVAADGAFETGAVTQALTGLTVGKVYELDFYWGAGQQQGFTTATTENWQVSLGVPDTSTATLVAAGSQNFTTPTYSLAAKGFSGWMYQSLDFTATNVNETLSFLAHGTPNGQPPFLLLGNVSMDVVPEPSSWVFFVGLGAAGILIQIIRRRRRSACAPVD